MLEWLLFERFSTFTGVATPFVFHFRVSLVLKRNLFTIAVTISPLFLLFIVCHCPLFVSSRILLTYSCAPCIASSLHLLLRYSTRAHIFRSVAIYLFIRFVIVSSLPTTFARLCSIVAVGGRRINFSSVEKSTNNCWAVPRRTVKQFYNRWHLPRFDVASDSVLLVDVNFAFDSMADGAFVRFIVGPFAGHRNPVVVRNTFETRVRVLAISNWWESREDAKFVNSFYVYSPGVAGCRRFYLYFITKCSWTCLGKIQQATQWILNEVPKQ